MAILGILMTLIIQVIGGVSSAWKTNSGRTAAFTNARAGVDALSRNLSQATLNTYLAYADAQGNPVPLVNPSFKHASATTARQRTPTQYLRMSELHFITGETASIFQTGGISGPRTIGQSVFFQMPGGIVERTDNRPKESLLNVIGYYIEFGSNADYLPSTTTDSAKPRYRYRLMEVLQPAERNLIYESTCELDPSSGLPVYVHDLRWINNLGLNQAAGSKNPLADNVLALAFLPKVSPLQQSGGAANALSPDFSYDSRDWEKTNGSNRPLWRNQLPPLMEMILICVDEPSAIKMEARFGGPGGTQPPAEASEFRAAVDLTQYFKDPLKISDDIAAIEKGLGSLGLNYRTFRTDIAMDGSKWTDL